MTIIEQMTPEEYQKAREKAVMTLLRIRDYKHQRYLAHKTECADYNRLYNLKNRDKLLAQHHQYYLKNRSRILEHVKQRYLGSKEEVIAYEHQYRYKNADKVRAHEQQYHLDNPEITSTNNARRHARFLEAKGSFTTKEFRTKCELYNNRCVYCGKSVPLGPDHVIPLVKGGSNYIENILPSCKSCNCSKNTKTFAEFLNLHTQEEQEEILTRVYLADYPEEGLKERNGDS